ncbi:E3 ubiquitin-protein ligase SH3RF3 [Bubalus bubalis]|uniref:E3 ubiquitin-protein ligase SH3RF3 n=1 Tax=Bubalus bubalis TaxID=89462 RepID=UPI001E1B70C1|nr:E3 ubiquitin-protein ligase SH3RF3 [Bubalus bubalis]
MLLGAPRLCASRAAAAAQREDDGDRLGGDMDESSLLDLLECSVCLERLDTTAKVLPCQHTFCRRCLESIVSSRRELRCPECRILVGCGVDELPANILLVRLLDGIRQRPRAGASPGSSPPARPGPGPSPASGAASALAGGGGSSPGSPVLLPAAIGATSSLRELATSRSAPPAKGPPPPPAGKALLNFEGTEPGELRCGEGDAVVLQRRGDELWYHGLLPAGFVQSVRPLPPAPPQGKALYDFEMKDRDQDKDCLSFSKDEVLTVIRRVDDNWAEGKLRDKIGIFPLLYVELNDAAKQLMEMDKLGLASASSCLASLPSEAGAVASVAPGPTSGSTGAVSAFQRRVDSKKNAKKRHSFTALSVTHKSTQASGHRRSMEISAPVLISSSDPRAAARIGDLAHLSRSAPAQDSSAGSTPATEQQSMAPRVQLPLNVYLALYAYKPQKSDELELRKGDTYRVLEKCRDGWFKGTALRTGLSGVFPGNYVTPVSRIPVGGAGPPRNNAVGGSPLAKGMATTMHPGGGSLSSPATALRPALPLTTAQVPAQHQAASPPLGSCLRHTVQPAASQARSAGPTAAHPAQIQGRPTATVSPLRTQNSPSRLPAGLRPPALGSPQHSPQPVTQCPRPAIPLASAASAVTPPNVSAANLNGEAGGGPAGGLTASSPTSVGGRPDERKNEKKDRKSGLLKLLAGASTRRKSRSPPSTSPTHDPQAVDASLQGAVGPEVSLLSIHGRAGSCPIEGEMQGALGMEPLHRKAGSLDLSFPSPTRPAAFSTIAVRPEPKPLPRERYRVVVSYPPQSEAEIELKEGDVVFVHKKREDGWYKGTLQRNGRTGLFPGSFVESF